MLQREMHGRVIGNTNIVPSHKVVKATESRKLHPKENEIKIYKVDIALRNLTVPVE